MADVRIRPIPGFPGYFAGDDGCMYRQFKGHVNTDSPRMFAVIRQDGKNHRHPLAWFVARAWVDGYDPDPAKKMLPAHRNGDFLDCRPENLEWVDVAGKPRFEVEKRHRAKMRRQLAEDPQDRRHGTRAGYRYGCRCPRCSVMGKVINRENQLKKMLRELEEADDGERG